MLLQHNKVTCIEPSIALFKHIAQNFLLAGLGIRIAVKRVLLGDAGNQQSGFIDRHALHKRIITTHRLVFINIILNDVPRAAILRRPADGFVEVENIHKTGIALRGTIKFMHPRNPKTVFEFHPNIRAQAIAQNAGHIMRFITLALGLRQQIAQQLTNINRRRRFKLNAILPELAG